MTTLIISLVGLILLIYSYTIVVAKDSKKVLLHRLNTNYNRMIALYRELENAIFLKDYKASAKKGKISYDLYLTAISHQKEVFENEFRELHNSKFTSRLKRRFNAILRNQDKSIKKLESELYRISHKRQIEPHNDSQFSA